MRGTENLTESELQGSTDSRRDFAARMERAISTGANPLSDEELEQLRSDIRVFVEEFLAGYPGPNLIGMPPAPAIRDVLDVWIDISKSEYRYQTHPGDYFVVHKIIPELLYPQERHRSIRPMRPSSAVVDNRTGEVTWDPPLPPEEATRRVLMARRQRDSCAHLEFHANRVRDVVTKGHHPMVYWIGYYMHCVNADFPPTANEQSAGEASAFVANVETHTVVSRSTSARRAVMSAALERD